jgi:hypothetical protein
MHPTVNIAGDSGIDWYTRKIQYHCGRNRKKQTVPMTKHTSLNVMMQWLAILVHIQEI